MAHTNPEQRTRYLREYQLKNRERIRANQQIYNRANRELCAKRSRDYYNKNKADPTFQAKLKETRAKRRPKHRAYMLRVHYGISTEQYEKMFAEQSGLCAICKQPETSKRIKYLHVDHRHSDKKVRGLLCHSCNTSIGGFKESPELLRSAIRYLEVHDVS